MSLRVPINDPMFTQAFAVDRLCKGSLVNRFRAYTMNRLMGSIFWGEEREPFVARVTVLRHLKSGL